MKRIVPIVGLCMAAALGACQHDDDRLSPVVDDNLTHRFGKTCFDEGNGFTGRTVITFGSDLTDARSGTYEQRYEYYQSPDCSGAIQGSDTFAAGDYTVTGQTIVTSSGVEALTLDREINDGFFLLDIYRIEGGRLLLGQFADESDIRERAKDLDFKEEYRIIPIQ